MSKNSKGFCSACLRDQLRCNRGKPKCDKCIERGTKCSYSFKLKWGGRQYKDMRRSARIPNTKFCKDALLVKDRRLIVGKSTRKIKQFLQFGQESNLISFFEKKSEETVEREDTDQLESETSRISVFDAKELAPLSSACSEIIPLQGSPTFILPQLVGTGPEKNPWEISTLFDLFINETAGFFVAFNSQVFPNPYRTILPQMALGCPTLMKLILAFGAKHRKMIAMVDEGADYPSLEENRRPSDDCDYMGEIFLNEALHELVEKLQDLQGRADEPTIAIILLLSSLGIFFNDNRGNWRTHYNAAKGIVANELRITEKSDETTMYYKKNTGARHFVLRWFIYLDIVGPLSSRFFHSKLEEEQVPRPHFNLHWLYSELLGEDSMELLSDINPLNGMDMKLLSYLTRVSELLLEKEKSSVDQEDHFKTVSRAISLDYKISSHLQDGESERDLIVKKLEAQANPLMEKRLKCYDILRTSNLVIGLTAMLQLRRRIVEMKQDCKLVIQLIERITDLVRTKITVNSPALSCMSFCFFTVGCELVEDSMSIHRNVFRDRLMSLWKKGVPSVLQAITVMEDCWRLKKSWWTILEEKNLDICLAF